MIAREKILGLALGTVAVGGLLYALAGAVVLRPMRKFDEREQALRTEISELVATEKRMARDVADYPKLRNRTFADTPLAAGVMVGSRINELAGEAGLGQHQFTATTFTGAGGTGFGVVGCNVKGQKVSLSKLTNFLYLLRTDRHLHRVTNLEITPQKASDVFNFTLRYVTPVLDRKTSIAVARREPMTPADPKIASLNADQRTAYNVIADRNLFRPYRRPNVAPPRARREPPPPPPRGPVAPPPPAPAPAYDRLVVTGLPAYGDNPEVHLTQPGIRNAKVHKVGDKIPLGEIVMVDYRVLMVPGSGKRKRPSSSRVILKIGRNYWAVERGQPLGQRRLLKSSELPGKLRPRPTSRPAIAGKPAPRP